MKKMVNIGFICSGGGHLTELLQIAGISKDSKKFLVTYQGINNEIHSYKFFTNKYKLSWTFSNPIIMFINFLKIIIILLKEKPKFLISTGGELAVPFFYLSKIFFGTKLIYLEIYARVSTTSIAGRFVYPITDLFLVQWKSLTQKYGKKAKYIGALV